MGGLADAVFGGGDIANVDPARQVELQQWGGSIDPTAIPASFGGQGLADAYGAGAQQQNAGIQNAINQQQLGFQGATNQFNQTQANFNPFIEGGQNAYGQQQAMSGAMGGAAQQQAYDQIQASPAQQFIRDRAQKTLMQNAAISGDAFGGRTAQALSEQAMGFAMQDADQHYSRLGQMATQGLNAAGTMGQLGQGYAQQGLGVSSNIANAMGQMGQNQAQAGLGAAGAMQQEAGQQYQAGINQFGQQVQQQGAENQFNLNQQNADFQNVANTMNVNATNANIAQQNAANSSANMGNLMSLGGMAAGFAMGGPAGAGLMSGGSAGAGASTAGMPSALFSQPTPMSLPQNTQFGYNPSMQPAWNQQQQSVLF